MAFTFDRWGTLGGQSRVGNAFQAFVYKTNDTINDILAAGYFNANRGNLRKNDLIFIHREDINGQNPADFIIRITSTPATGDITSSISTSDDWTDDGSSLKPTIDGRHVDTGSGDLITNEGTFKALDASKIVHTDGDKKLTSIDINSAYNKDFRANIPSADTDAGDPGDSTDIPRGNHSHPKTQATETIIGQSERATQAETNNNTDDLRHITPLKLSGRTATETRTGITEVATQPETDAETDDSRIVTPLKLAGKKASQAEAEAAIDNVKIMTSLRTKQFSDYNLALKRVIIANNSIDPDNDIDFTVGRMWNTDRTRLLNLPAFTKRLDANFAPGNNAGMLRTGATKASNTWYDLYGIEKDSDLSTDYYADDDASGPSHIPSGYSNPTYIGSIKTDGSSNIKDFFQIGTIFIWKDFITDFDSDVGTTASLAPLSVPPGKNCLTFLYGRSQRSGAANDLLFSSPLQTDTAVSATGGEMNLNNLSDEYRGLYMPIMTNTFSQIRLRASASSSSVSIGVSMYKNMNLEAQ